MTKRDYEDVQPEHNRSSTDLQLEVQDKDFRFVHIGKTVYMGSRTACIASSMTMARRIANALNKYDAGKRGY